MEDKLTASEFRDAMAARVKAARKAAGYTQEEMAELLGIAQGTYKQYETRSFLPHKFIPRFCLITHASERWLLSGRGRGIPINGGS